MFIRQVGGPARAATAVVATVLIGVVSSAGATVGVEADRLEQTSGVQAAQETTSPTGSVVVGYTSPKHVFGIDDVVGNGQGETDAENPNVVKDGDPGETVTGESILAPDGSVLYPIDSSFGFDVEDYVGSTPRESDGVAAEGYVGVLEGGGIQVSNVETAVLQTEDLVGKNTTAPWGKQIKASSEHFTVMEAVHTCYQTVPYDYWSSQEDYQAGLPSVPDLQDVAECASTRLPDPVTDAEVAAAMAALVPNEDILVPGLPNVYLGSSYAVTQKEDGKFLYRWGTTEKKSTEVLVTARLPLPASWARADGKGYRVTKAELVVRHSVTNNPNDHIRPEGWENETDATGRQPEYTVQDGRWLSTKDCHEADGDFIPAGTVLRDLGKAVPGAPSPDLEGGFSNAWYTSLDRDPFEWAYRTPGGDLVGSPVRDDSIGSLVSGPSWRLLAPKYGQDIPGLEVPAVPCEKPPYAGGNKYLVGDAATTTINLLDWSDDPAEARWDDAGSPFAWTAGWTSSWSGVDTVPGQQVLPEDSTRCSLPSESGGCLTDGGLELTDGFDLALSVKGDKKPVKIYDAELRLEYAVPDAAAPRSRAGGPAYADTRRFQVDYTASDPVFPRAGVDRVQLWVKRAGETDFVRRQVDRGAEMDGAFTIRSFGLQGKFRYATRARDRLGNWEPVPTKRDAVTVVDTVAPRTVNPRVVPNPYDIGDDRFTELRTRISEKARTTFLVKRNGVVVKRFATELSPRGLVTQKWFGRNDVGKRVLSADYVVVTRAKDLAGNLTLARVRLRVTR